MKLKLILALLCFMLVACDEELLNPQKDSMSIGATNYNESLVDPLIVAAHGTQPDVSMVWLLQGVNQDQSIDQGLILSVSAAQGITGTFTTDAVTTEVVAVYATGINSPSELLLGVDPSQTSTVTITGNEAVGGKMTGSYNVHVCDPNDCAGTTTNLTGTFSATVENTNPPANFGV